LHEDEIDDILFLARTNDFAELDVFFSECARKYACSKGAVLTGAVDEMSGNTALHYAAANGHMETIESILSTLAAGASAGGFDSHVHAARQRAFINRPNEAGNTALHWASLNGHIKAAQRLVAAGADATLKNAVGHDAVFEAELNGKSEVVGWLLAHAAGLEPGAGGAAQDSEGDAPQGNGDANGAESK
ncbi:ankyrin repeat-containing domain protein, partial [Lineolata rhizophorae]